MPTRWSAATAKRLRRRLRATSAPMRNPGRKRRSSPPMWLGAETCLQRRTRKRSAAARSASRRQCRLKENRCDEEQDKSPVSFKATVARLPQKGMPVVIEADARQREALAAAHGLVSVERFRAELLVAPWKRNGVKVSGHVEADITQECVVTLEPLQARSARAVEGLFLPEDSKLGRLGFEGGGEILLDAEGPDSPETFSGDTIDVGALAEEFFGLASIPIHASPARRLPDGGRGRGRATEGPLQEKLRRLARKDLNSPPSDEIAVVRRPKTLFSPKLCQPLPRPTRDDCRVIRISIDAMGGDHGPSVVIPGLMKVATRRNRRALSASTGRVDEVRPVLDKFPKLAAVSELIHCEIAVRMDDKPSQALRHGRWKSSMWKAIEAVKAGQADACISAGNTGALMAMSRFCLRTMATIDRPAIAAIWPTHARRKRGARCRRDDRRRRAPADRFRDPGRGHVARAVRHRPADGRAAECRRRGDQGPGRGQGSRPAAARGRPDVDELSRLRRGRRSRQGHGRRGRDRGLFRQHRAEDGRRHRAADRLLSAGRDEAAR